MSYPANTYKGHAITDLTVDETGRFPVPEDYYPQRVRDAVNARPYVVADTKASDGFFYVSIHDRDVVELGRRAANQIKETNS